MSDIMMVLLEVIFLSFIMRIAAGFCVDRAKASKNKNIRFFWFVLSLAIVCIALIIAISLLFSLFMKRLF